MIELCQVCLSAEGRREFMARDLTFGIEGEYKYAECLACGSVQATTIPDDETLVLAYSNEYRTVQSEKIHPIKKWIRTQRDRSALGLPSLVGSLANLKTKDSLISILKQIQIGREDGILDVGCGPGYVLDRLRLCGFSNLTGIDPFMPPGYRTSEGVPVINVSLEDAPGEYDLIMFNHSLEHVKNIAEALKLARGKLKSGALCLIRIPTTSSDAWLDYGALWAQLDAPRHIVVPSRPGMKVLAERCGFVLERTIDDSTAYFQFCVSEAHRRGYDLKQSNIRNLFSRTELSEFERKAAELNLRHRGDQAAFFLRAN